MGNRGLSSLIIVMCAGGGWGCSIYDPSLLEVTQGATEGTAGDPSTGAGGDQLGRGGTISDETSDASSETAATDAGSDSADVPREAAPLPASCMDTVKNGTETDVDCGGADCARCATAKACLGWHDCDGGICTAGRCAIAKTCSEILTRSPGTASGVYQIDVDATGPASPFPVFCDMKTTSGGWTRVGFEPSGSGGKNIPGRLAYLGIEVSTPVAIANASGPGLIGARFNGLYKEIWINWGNTFARMTVPGDIFVNSVDTAIPVTHFVTSDAKIIGWVNGAGSAIFCRASKSVDQRPGDTSWGIKPANDLDTSCGCSGGGWTGRGGFYGGVVPATLCSSWGGAWAGAKDDTEPKGGLESNVDLTLWVR